MTGAHLPQLSCSWLLQPCRQDGHHTGQPASPQEDGLASAQSRRRRPVLHNRTTRYLQSPLCAVRRPRDRGDLPGCGAGPGHVTSATGGLAAAIAGAAALLSARAQRAVAAARRRPPARMAQSGRLSGRSWSTRASRSGAAPLQPRPIYMDGLSRGGGAFHCPHAPASDRARPAPAAPAAPAAVTDASAFRAEAAPSAPVYA